MDASTRAEILSREAQREDLAVEMLSLAGWRIRASDRRWAEGAAGPWHELRTAVAMVVRDARVSGGDHGAIVPTSPAAREGSP